MNKSEKLTFVRIAAVGIVISGIGYLFNQQIGNGILLGLLFGLLHYSVMYIYMSLVVKIDSFRLGWFALYFLGNIGIFAVPLYIGSVYPDYVNVFGAAVGLTIHNLYVYGNSFMQKFRKER